MECYINYEEVGQRIRHARKNKRWTQAKLAETVGCSTANITNIEKSKTKLSLNMLVRISEVLEVSLDELIGGKAAPASHTSSPIEAEIQSICAGLSSENAQLCRQACVEFCAAFSRHFTQI